MVTLGLFIADTPIVMCLISQRMTTVKYVTLLGQRGEQWLLRLSQIEKQRDDLGCLSNQDLPYTELASDAG